MSKTIMWVALVFLLVASMPTFATVVQSMEGSSSLVSIVGLNLKVGDILTDLQKLQDVNFVCADEVADLRCNLRLTNCPWQEALDVSLRSRGYWTANCPVQTNHPAVKATAYVHHGKRLAIAVASWAPEPVEVSLDIDWKAVGLDPTRVRVTVPEIAMYQPALASASLDAFPVDPGKGWIVTLEVEQRNRRDGAARPG